MEATIDGLGTDREEALWDAKNKAMHRYGPQVTLALIREVWLSTDTDGIQHWVFHFEVIEHA